MDRHGSSLVLLLLFVVCTGGVLLGALLVLVLLDVVGPTTSSGGADIGAGLVRLVFLLLVGVAAARLAVRAGAARRAR